MRTLFLSLAVALSAVANAADLLTLKSPDGKNVVTVSLNNGAATYHVDRNGKRLIDNSNLGMITNDGDFSKNLKSTGTSTSTINETYKMWTGKFSSITNRCNQAKLSFTAQGGQSMDVVFRAYNDGVAFRYVFNGGKKNDFVISNDVSEINVPSFTRAWGQKWTYDYSQGYKVFDWNGLRNEQGNDNRLGNGGKCSFAAPMLVESSNGNDSYILLTDAAVDKNFSRAPLRANAAKGHFGFQMRGTKNNGLNVTTVRPLNTPWRVAIIGKLTDIAVSNMCENLTDATQKDPSGGNWNWVKPGFSSWDWGGEQGGNCKNLTDDSQAKRYIDFAAAMGWKYFTLDEGWESSSLNGNKEAYVKDICSYAKKKGVGVILWKGSGGLGGGLNGYRNTFKKYKEYGAVGAKIDFFYDGDTKGVMQKQEELLQAAAENQLMINFHGCPTPTGLRRKWPNEISVEAVDGNEDYFTGGWNNTGTDPGYNGMLTLMRNVVGPMDYTICEFRTGTNGTNTIRDNTTVAQQLATMVTMESGIQFIADAPKNVQGQKWENALKNVPASWDESRCLEATIGANGTAKDIKGNADINCNVTMARRSGRNWFVGRTVNLESTYNLDCSFLGNGTYKVTIYKDGSADTQKNVLQVETRNNVTSATKISIKCYKYGGFFARFDRTDNGGNTPAPAPDTDTQFYLYNVGTKQWIKTGGKAKTPDSPALVAQSGRTANVILEQADGTYKICDPEYAPQGWGVQGRNTIYESNNGSQNTRSWGTTLVPGFKFISTGDADGSVYIEYTWGNWTKGNNDIVNPSGKTYGLYYGNWALGTNGWAGNTTNDVADKGVYSDLADNLPQHGANAKWIIYPVGKGKIKVLPNPNLQYYLYNVGQNKFISTGGKSKNPDIPTLVDKSKAVAQMITTNADGTISIADPEYYPQGWGIQGRNTIYESNNGSEKTNSWGTTLIPGWKMVSTGDADGSVYLEYTWGTWTAGRLNIDNPSNKTYVLTYGDYDQNTNAWNNAQKEDVAQPLVYGGSVNNRSAYGANAKWIITTSLDNPSAARRVAAPTAIKSISSSKKQNADKAVYNILGQKVADDASQLHSLPRGLYIVGGKKITIK